MKELACMLNQTTLVVQIWSKKKKIGNKDAVDLSSDGCEGNMDSQKPPLSKSAR